MFVPATVLIAILAGLFLPQPGARLVVGAVLACLAVYFAVLALAVLKTALPRPEIGGWRWVGVALTASNAMMAAFLAVGQLFPA